MKNLISLCACMLFTCLGMVSSAGTIRSYYRAVDGTFAGPDASLISPATANTPTQGSKTFTATCMAGQRVSKWYTYTKSPVSSRDAEEDEEVGSGNSCSYSTTTSADVHLVAYFEYIPLTVSFERNGATSGSTAPITGKNYDSSFPLTANGFFKTGYHFTGWSNASGKTFANGQLVNGSDFWNASSFDSVLSAQWAANAYTIAFDGNDATSGSMNSLPCQYDTSATLPENAYVRTGYSFSGWNTKRDGTGTPYANGASVKNLTAEQGATITLYAQWTRMYNVEFRWRNRSGGVVSETKKANYGDSVAAPSDDEVNQWLGHTFLRWDSVEYLQVVRDCTITAEYGANNYLIEFDPNGGAGTTIGPISCSYDENVKLPKNRFTRQGYDFLGWSDDAKATEAYYPDEAEVSRLTPEDGGVVVLYAVWRPIRYNIGFDSNGGEGTMTMLEDVEYGREIQLPKNVFVYLGRNFLHWECNGVEYADGETVSNLVDKAGVAMLKAIWDMPSWIEFSGNAKDAEGEMDVLRLDYGVTNNLPANQFSRLGHEFCGWATNSTRELEVVYTNQQAIAVTDSAMIGKTNTLLAVWQPISYVVKFAANGGSGNGPADRKLLYGDSLTMPESTFTPPKYSSFLFWSEDPVNTDLVYRVGETVSNLTTVANSTNTLYAIWRYDVGDLSRVLDINNLMFTNEISSTWFEDTSTWHCGGSSFCHRGPEDSIALYVDLDESGSLSFWWKGVPNELAGVKYNYLEVCEGEVGSFDRGKVLATCYAAGDSTWSNTVIKIDVPAGTTKRIWFCPSDVTDQYFWLDHVTWTAGGEEPGPKDVRNISAITFADGKWSFTFKDADAKWKYILHGSENLQAERPWEPVGKPVSGASGDSVIQVESDRPQMFFYLETTAP